MVTIFTMGTALVFAGILTREKLKGQDFFRIVFYIPNILSVVAGKEIFEFNKTRPIIYLSLGTVVNNKKFIKTCIHTFKNENVDVIISTKEKIKDCPSNIHVYKYVPQTSVLKITDCFITHGGMNSISEAFVENVPMLVIPFSSDQPVNARCVEKLGVGIQFDYKNLNEQELKEKVFSLINNENIKNHYMKVQEYIKNSPGNSGAVQIILDYYKKELSYD